MKYLTGILLFIIAFPAFGEEGKRMNGVFTPDLEHIRSFQAELMKSDDLDEEIKAELIDAYVKNVKKQNFEVKIEFPKVVYNDGNVSFEGKITQYSNGYFLIELNGILLFPGYYDTEDRTIMFHSFKWNRSEPVERVNG